MDIIIIYNDICHCTDFHWSSQKFLGKVEISQQLFFSQEIHRWPAFVMLEVKQMENRKVLQQNARKAHESEYYSLAIPLLHSDKAFAVL
ncbi:uncharacterized protein RHO17_011354 isoform 2-T2 [Thomomys bottae]